MSFCYLKENIPIVLYAFFYSIFTLIGISFFIFDNKLYMELYEIFSGVSRPALAFQSQYWILFLVAYISPIIFIFSFYFGFKTKRFFNHGMLKDIDEFLT